MRQMDSGRLGMIALAMPVEATWTHLLSQRWDLTVAAAAVPPCCPLALSPRCRPGPGLLPSPSRTDPDSAGKSRVDRESRRLEPSRGQTHSHWHSMDAL